MQNKTAIGSALQTMMKYLGAKQAVINENIANANTPGYRAKELQKFDFASLLAGKTEAPSSASAFKIITQNDKDIEPSPDGNTVNTQKEMVELSQVTLDYQATLQLYRKIHDMFKVALGNRA